MKKIFLILIVSLLIGGCGDISEEDLECIIQTGKPCDNSPTPAPTVVGPTVAPQGTPTKAPTKAPTAKPSANPTSAPGMNPMCSSTPQDSRAHLLWKPVSDTSGNAVAVFDGKYKKEFLNVKAELSSGKFEDLYWKGLVLWGNPDKDGPRQHWRSRNKCRSFKNKGLIIADDGYQTCSFRLPGDACKRWE